MAIAQSLRKRPRLSPFPKRTPLKIAAWKCCDHFGGALGLELVFESVVMGSTSPSLKLESAWRLCTVPVTEGYSMNFLTAPESHRRPNAQHGRGCIVAGGCEAGLDALCGYAAGCSSAQRRPLAPGRLVILPVAPVM